MSEINNNQPDNNQNMALEVNQQNDLYSIFNDPMNVEYYDEDEIPVGENDFWSASTHVEETEAASQENNNAAAEQNQKNEEGDLNFEDPILSQEEASAEKKSDDDLKAELEKRGFKVSKEEGEDTSAKRVQEVERLNNVISDAKNFLNLPPDVIVKEKLKTELSREYANSGKQGLIGSEEFQLDLESEFEQYSQNTALLNIYANNIKTEVQNVIADSEGKVKQISSEVETEQKKLLIEKRTSLQNGIKSIHQSGIFGIKPTPDQSKEIYNSIISGEFTKAVNSDPNLVAEFATYRKFREEINSKLGGPKYGEGVKAAAEAINGGPLKTETPLANVVKNTTQGITGSGGQNDRRKSWSAETVPIGNSQNDQKNVIAGTGSSFL